MFIFFRSFLTHIVFRSFSPNKVFDHILTAIVVTFFMITLASPSYLPASSEWKSSYIIKAQGKTIGVENFIVSSSDGFNVFSGTLQIRGKNSSGENIDLERKFKIRSWPPFYEPFSSVVSDSKNFINRCRVDGRTVSFQQNGTSKEALIKTIDGDKQLLFLIPQGCIGYSALIQAYDMSNKGLQQFMVVNPIKDEIFPVSVDYRGQEHSDALTGDLVRRYDVRGIGDETLLIKADRFGKVLFIENTHSGYVAFLEGTISVSPSVNNKNIDNMKALRVAVGGKSSVVEASFYFPETSASDKKGGKYPCILFLSNVDDLSRVGKSEAIDEQKSLASAKIELFKEFVNKGFCVLDLPPGSGFVGDVELVNNSRQWLKTRNEVDNSKVIMISRGLSFAALCESLAKNNDNLPEAVVFLNPPFKPVDSLVLSFLERELSGGGYDEDYKVSVKEKFQRFLHNVNTQSQGYQGVLKHSIDEVRGWSFPLVERIVKNPRSFDGYILTFFGDTEYNFSFPVFASSQLPLNLESIKNKSLVKARFRKSELRKKAMRYSGSVTVFCPEKSIDSKSNVDELKKFLSKWIMDI